MLEYISAPEAAKKWDISERWVQILCAQRRSMLNVSKLRYMWLIPQNIKDCIRKKKVYGDKIC